MSEPLLLGLFLASLATTALSASGARALAEFSRHELEEICRRRKRPQRLGQILRGYERAALAAETLELLAVGGLAACVTVWLDPGEIGRLSALAAVGKVAAALFTLLAAAVWIPFAVVRLWASPLVYFTWPLWRLVALVLSPLVLGARFADAVFHRLAGRQPEQPDEDSFEEEIRTIVTEGHREGLLEEDAREMIEGVIELGDITVSQIMTPRTDMLSLPFTLTWQEAVAFVISAGHSRIPVHRKNRDDVVGVLYIKDLLPELSRGDDGPRTPWTSLLRSPYFVPETKPVDVLLQEFQRTGNHMAVVLDEYGGVSGLVTMEDVLEEIVGEIQDESDEGLVEDVRVLDDATAEARGRAHLDELNDQLQVDLPENADFDTIGGFVFNQLGHVPVVGEQLVWKNLRITVLEATPRRVERVRIEVLDRGLATA